MISKETMTNGIVPGNTMVRYKDSFRWAHLIGAVDITEVAASAMIVVTVENTVIGEEATDCSKTDCFDWLPTMDGRVWSAVEFRRTKSFEGSFLSVLQDHERLSTVCRHHPILIKASVAKRYEKDLLE
jgi:hypothetical protein